MESAPQTNQELIRLVVQHFQKLPRGPYGVDNALLEAKQEDANSTQKVILDESEPAWRAYYAAKKAAESQHGFSGKAELTRLLVSLNTEPVECRRTFAKQLAAAMERATPQSREGNRNNSSGVKRRRITIEDHSSISSTPSTTPNAAENNYANAERHALGNIPTSVNLQEGVHVDAALKASKALFPIDFMDSIQRIRSTRLPDTLVADITMFLQKGYIRDFFGCQMEIGIVKEKVAHYAKKLFSVEVEVKDGVRYIRYPGGGKVEPDPSIKLRACLRDTIPGVFGADVDLGFSSAPIYQREEKEVRDHTDGISMAISNRENEGGKITLFLGEWHAFIIKKKLYD
ncbi:hypothetical protein B0J11DRAFT_198741 [Dendryphion nanum]|uniref:Uncharacterized protein n=1 Tax=Dendryphion nanum TaxID=256645 RepID=A0A9P9I7T4_9PLEO|nr:hypothetical protein B0J11DRAFT_198741 [Dendryphion nanum]